jgi:hypothetical protein
MPRLPHISETTAIVLASVALAVAVGVVTSSLLGVGIFLLAPALTAWLLRR